jgi:hypothetical protein
MILGPTNPTPYMKMTRLLHPPLAFSLLCAILAFSFAPALRAETPPDQIKAAGAIPLTIGLLDKMDAVIKALGDDAAAKAEMTEIGKDPNMTPESWAVAINAKCPKAAAHFKTAGVTADDFAKGTFAIMACAMSEDLTKSEDKAAKANADFVAANKDRAEKTFGSFMQLSMPADASSPAPTP